MYIARILYPVKVLGPGNRIGIWFNGCSHHCLGCSNPELWEKQERYKISFETLMHLIYKICETQQVDGFTITGGEPFQQPEALYKLLPKFSQISNDILVYTGYDFNFLKNLYPNILEYISVLIDGKYIEEQNTEVPLRGSDNQNIIILNNEYKDKYYKYINSNKNEIQNFTTLDGVISVGIHRPGYEIQLDDIIRKKGLENI